MPTISTIIVSTVLCAMCISVAALTPVADDTPVKWEIIREFHADGLIMYVDKNSTSRNQTEKFDIATGSFLLVPVDGAIQFKNKNQKLISAMSIVRAMAVDCRHGFAVPVMDLYFDTKTPDKSSKPIGSTDYEKASPINIFPKTSTLFKTLCPNFIT